ncbi:MAG: NAD-dependent epimerase/dehydratase family protein, partial [Candidatus Marinimicrobia bacterium]|nr:NAD-dependent epimerase/dehydratase family protein [Candidatus Neomarinimicrobiota bacterium]
GPNDNFHLENSHVIPALIRRIHTAKKNNIDQVVIWGSGNAMREFLYVEDMADACVFTIQNLEANELYANGIEHINIGSGADLTINKLAQSIKDIIGYSGKIVFDKTKPDGTPRKLLDVSRITGLGWESRIDLITGLKNSYKYYLQNLTE